MDIKTDMHFDKVEDPYQRQLLIDFYSAIVEGKSIAFTPELVSALRALHKILDEQGCLDNVRNLIWGNIK